ncbi:LIRP-like isoform X2 [Aphidius gifuensis]|nr:LIRP-like isoform X2 [Aphidius gifuensis]
MSINGNMLALLLVMSFIAVNLTNCQSDLYDYIQKRHENPAESKSASMYYCGQKLSSALQLLCNGIYNVMLKKNNQELDMDNFAYFYNWPLSPRASANSMMGIGRFGGERFRRQSRGIHDECCLRSCSINELKSYCGEPSA